MTPERRAQLEAEFGPATIDDAHRINKAALSPEERIKQLRDHAAQVKMQQNQVAVQPVNNPVVNNQPKDAPLLATKSILDPTLKAQLEKRGMTDKLNELEQGAAQANPDLYKTPLDKATDAVLGTVGKVSDLAKKTHIPQIVGRAIGAVGAGIGGAVGAVGQIGKNIVTQQPLLKNVGQSAIQNATDTAKFGQDIGTEGAANLPFAALGAVPGAIIGAASVYQGAKDTAMGIEDKNATQTTQGLGEVVGGGLGLHGGISGVKDITTSYSKGEIVRPSSLFINPEISNSPLANKAKEVFIERWARTNPEKVSEAVDTFTKAINPLKSDIKKIEVKSGKELNDVMQFMLEEQVKFAQTKEGKINTLPAVEELLTKKSKADELLANSLDNTQQRNDLVQIANMAKRRMDSQFANATELKQARANIDAFIQDEIERYGRANVTDRELHDIKNGMWSVGYDTANKTKSPAAKSIGNIAKQRIEINNPDTNIRGLNNLSSMYRTSIDLLTGIHGNVVQGGKLGGWFSRIIGGYVVQSILGKVPGVGPLASFLGQIIGKNYNEFVNDPERIINIALKQARKANLEPRSVQILEEFKTSLQNKDMQAKLRRQLSGIETRQLLPAPGQTSPTTIEVPSPGVLSGQRALRE